MEVLTKKLTYQEFRQMDFGDDDPAWYELINGQIVKKQSPTLQHQRISKNIFRALDAYALKTTSGEALYAPLDVVLDDDNVYHPDVFFVKKERSFILENSEEVVMGAPDLVIEILSKSTGIYDKGAKKDASPCGRVENPDDVTRNRNLCGHEIGHGNGRQIKPVILPVISTYLRSVGVNVVLAMAGSVVCAQRFALSPVQLITSMRIADNLEENTSTFYAELKKLKIVIERVNKEEKIFILLDEILRGTNSLDRHTGSAALIKQLIKKDACAIIATHDVELAKLKEMYPANILNYYFDVQVSNDELYFDYKLKEGICSSLNASILMRKIGIEM